MGALDYVLLAGLAVWLFFAVRRAVKAKGGCASCSGCSGCCAECARAGGCRGGAEPRRD